MLHAQPAVASAAGEDAPDAPQKRETQLAGWEFAKENREKQAGIIGADELTRKRESTLTAECALVGVALIPSTNDRGARVYVVTRWALCKELPDLDSVEAWLARVKGGIA
ncbi:hypothetical protein ACIPRI_14665 [Variovorax sp. LARHSF232]